jgi:transposase
VGSVWTNGFSPVLDSPHRYRLKDFRPIATRYDRLATNFIAAVYLAPMVSYWA